MNGYSFFNRLAYKANTLPPKLKLDHQDPLASQKLSSNLGKHLLHLNSNNVRPVAVVAIGTDRSTGDSLGPLTGSKLKEFAIPDLSIYGTLDDPVHASNMIDKLRQLEKDLNNPIIIAIDACLGQSESVGSITLSAGPVRPGAGVNKSLPTIGHVHYTGIVNVSGYMEYFVLQNTRLSIVMRMATLISTSIMLGIRKVRTSSNAYLVQ
ncbi:spore protease YyaC [Metallumcola ferriviriculae]|uniref:Spore protease YyaC n=1 Tax=Metallumcola ferriviriculae TaxID=3039180 RepID=A0AAU0UK89_9FIRM|nr:spore protease YyaC [Desulfitibacteraceae bacterium MK1]